MPNALDEVAAKGAGVAHATAARLRGLTGVFNTLAEQHAEMHALLKSVQGSKSAAKQRDLWPHIRAELLSHERAEVTEVYAALTEYAPLLEMVERHRVEAKQLEAAIQRVDRTDYAGDTWSSHIGILIEMVDQHAREEENEFFPLALETIGKQVSEALDERFAVAKRAIRDELVQPQETRL